MHNPAFLATTIALVLLVGVLLWGHYVLFGKWEPMRIVLNVAVAGAIVTLLKIGQGG